MPSAQAQNIVEEKTAPPLDPPAPITGEALRDYGKYFTDESRQAGTAAALVFPRNTAEVAAVLRRAAEQNLPVTVSGARTGIAAGAVPAGGLVLSLERMNRICGLRPHGPGEFLVECEAGLALADLQKAVITGRFADSATWDAPSREALEAFRKGRWFYPPDPTETSASIGGTIACNASGAHTFRYGPTRDWVHAAEIVLADGGILTLERGKHRLGPDHAFHIRRPNGTLCTVPMPHYRFPKVKNAAGYYAEPGMDLLDLFIGSEGTLGIITKAWLRVRPRPEVRCLAATFWHNEKTAVDFAIAVRERRERLGIEAIEYMDPGALAFLLRRRRALGAASQVPECLPETARAAVFVDTGLDETAFPHAIAALEEQVRALGGTPEQDWSALSKSERERLRLFRHALPEAVNSRISEIRRQHPGITKLGTDMAVPDARLRDVIRLYRTTLDQAGLEYVIFGHIGNNHLHVNILPQNDDEYALGKKIYLDFAREVVRMGGSPAAEHGIGKLKRDFLTILFGTEGVAQMRRVKQALDPENRLGPGSLFP